VSQSPWIAVNAGTVHTKLARELRDAWEDFVGGEMEARAAGAGTPVVRDPIAASWMRSHEAGVDPLGRWEAPTIVDGDAVGARRAEHPLMTAMPVVRHCLAEAGEAADQLTVVSDADGLLLWVDGDLRTRGRAADDMNFAEGVLWSETAAGTNAVGTALAEGHAVQVFGAEHFSERVQRWTCSASPVFDPEDERLLGVIDITGDLSTANANGLSLVVATARAVEAFLTIEMHGRDERVRRRHGDLLLGRGPARAIVSPSGRVMMTRDADAEVISGRIAVGPDGGELVLPSGEVAVAEPLGDGEAFLVTRRERSRRAQLSHLQVRVLGDAPPEVAVDDRPCALRPRQVELLTLLAIHPRGIGADALSTELYGEHGSAGSVRVEISRLRKLLGPCVETEHYRLLWPVDSDVAEVKRLLSEGQLGAALDAYAGPLLPTSEAPGIRRERDELEGWLRGAVLGSDDVELQWRWATGPCGEDDLLAWSRVLGSLPFEDPRHARAAAHVRTIRERD
jgi:hypothetical protein